MAEKLDVQSDQEVAFTWEKIQKRNSGPSYGEEWDTFPCVSISKNAIILNEKFIAIFGLTTNNHVAIMYDQAKKVIGLQVAQNDNERIAGFKVVKNGPKSKCLAVGNRRVATMFPGTVGKAYVARMVPNSRIIYCDLNKPISPETVVNQAAKS